MLGSCSPEIGAFITDDAEIKIEHVRRNLYMLITLAYANLAVVTANKVTSFGFWHLHEKA